MAVPTADLAVQVSGLNRLGVDFPVISEFRRFDDDVSGDGYRVGLMVMSGDDSEGELLVLTMGSGTHGDSDKGVILVLVRRGILGGGISGLLQFLLLPCGLHLLPPVRYVMLLSPSFRKTHLFDMPHSLAVGTLLSSVLVLPLFAGATRAGTRAFGMRGDHRGIGA